MSLARRITAATLGAGALVLATAGAAYADEADTTDAPAPESAGATPVHVLKGVAPLPVPDPTLGAGTVLPPLFNAVGGLG